MSIYHQKFSTKIIRWHQNVDRQLPWKENKDPYKIWISEVILQQTRLAKGIDYYHQIINAFPTIKDMAHAEESELLYLWKGLGYYTRARNMHKAARIIIEEYQGHFPSDYDVLLSLPGIGPYTAAAISSFAFDQPHAVVDGNVYRVLSRYFGVTEAIDTGMGRRIFQKLAAQCLNNQRPAKYNQAIMDFGALICTPKAAKCDQCILKKDCQAHTLGSVYSLPNKSRNVRRRNRHFYYLAFECEGTYPVICRNEGDIWSKMYHFPMLEKTAPLPKESISENLLTRWPDLQMITDPDEELIAQKLTHQDIYHHFLSAEISRPFGTYEWWPLERIINLPLPIEVDRYCRRQLVN